MPGRRERGWSEHEMVEYSCEKLDTDLKTRISHGINFHTNISQSICELEVSHRTDIDSKSSFPSPYSISNNLLSDSPGFGRFSINFGRCGKREKGEMNFDTKTLFINKRN